jgi:hypothetical protein
MTITEFVPERFQFNLENKFPDLSIEEDSFPQDLISASLTKQLTLDLEVRDDFLATGLKDVQWETDDENPELSPLESSVEDEEYAGHDMDDLRIRMEQAIKNVRLKYPFLEECLTSAKSGPFEVKS